MEKDNYPIINSILENIRKIMNDRGLTQASIAEYANTTPSQMSRIFKGDVQLSLKQLSDIATSFQMTVVDVITYPNKYVDSNGLSDEEKAMRKPKVLLQLELEEEKKEQVLKIVFGENNLEILNK